MGLETWGSCACVCVYAYGTLVPFLASINRTDPTERSEAWVERRHWRRFLITRSMHNVSTIVVWTWQTRDQRASIPCLNRLTIGHHLHIAHLFDATLALRANNKHDCLFSACFDWHLTTTLCSTSIVRLVQLDTLDLCIHTHTHTHTHKHNHGEINPIPIGRFILESFSSTVNHSLHNTNRIII